MTIINATVSTQPTYNNVHNKNVNLIIIIYAYVLLQNNNKEFMILHTFQLSNWFSFSFPVHFYVHIFMTQINHLQQSIFFLVGD